MINVTGSILSNVIDTVSGWRNSQLTIVNDSTVAYLTTALAAEKPGLMTIGEATKLQSFF